MNFVNINILEDYAVNIENILRCFPKHIKPFIEKEELTNLEEIRVRNNLPLILKIGQAEKIIQYKITTDDINFIFQKICENSIYTYQNQIAKGFVTIQGGNRVGIVGTAVIQDDKVINLNYISGLNFRISSQITGCSDKIIKEIINPEDNSIYNTLIIGMPGTGKTTLLKDIIRNISNGFIYGDDKFSGLNVSVIDERGEISAMYRGTAQNNLGIRTDVLNDIPKAIGMKMAVRSMNPKVIAADEIGGKDDADAIRYAMRCGVKGIFSAHGTGKEDIMQNAELKELITQNIFERFITINKKREYKVET